MIIQKLNQELPYGIPTRITSYEVDSLKDKIEQLERRFNNSKPAEKLYLTKKEVMEFCGVTSPSTLWNWKEQGLLVPRARAGRKPLYLREDVLNFLTGNNKCIN